MTCPCTIEEEESMRWEEEELWNGNFGTCATPATYACSCRLVPILFFFFCSFFLVSVAFEEFYCRDYSPLLPPPARNLGQLVEKHVRKIYELNRQPVEHLMFFRRLIGTRQTFRKRWRDGVETGPESRQ